MTPWQKAYQSATAHGVSPQEWEERMQQCLCNGYVFSTPDEFLAAHDAEHNGEPAYFVLTAAGGSGNVLARFLRYAPAPRPWVLWCRNNERWMRIFRWEQLSKKAGI